MTDRVARKSLGSDEPEVTATKASFWRRFRRNRAAVLAACLLAALILLAIFGPLVMPEDPAAIALGTRNAPPSAGHLLGTDDLGRDVASRLVGGTRISLIAAGLAVTVALVIGLPLGLVSGYFGGWLDSLLMRLNDALMSFPSLMLAVAIVGILGPNLRNAMVAIGIVFAPRIMRVVRSSALALREENYVHAARTMGARHTSIMIRHVLPNLLSPLTVQVTIMLGLAILAEASLSFLGLGVQPPQPSWGAMLERSFPYMAEAPLNTIAPGFVISLTVWSFNMLGDGLRDSFGLAQGRADD